MNRFATFIGSSLRAPAALAWLLAASCALLALWWGNVNQDEGWYLYAAQLVHEGRLPYRDFFFTQGPSLPIVYSFLYPVWAKGALLQGLLGGRVVTLCFSLLSTALAVALVRRMVAPEKRPLASLAVFALLSCNLYHVYFTTIPKTYALGGAFVLVGFLFLAVALERGAKIGGVMAFLSGLAFAFASGTRISLVLILGTTGVYLLLSFRRWRWRFLWFGLGGVAGLFATYGLFALDPASLRGLLAAQAYHAARGGFDPVFAIGAVSRLSRGYAALGVVLFALLAMPRPAMRAPEAPRAVLHAILLGFFAVFLLQLSAPFPYDDYQVPIMGILAVAIVAAFAGRIASPIRAAWFVALTAGLCAFSAPQLQEWNMHAQDRFWSRKKSMSELAKMRLVSQEIEMLDPGGEMLLTQDLYLAVDAGRKVPEGLEMGPFSYFPELSAEEAAAVKVLDDSRFEKVLDSAPCAIAAFSGYGFAIASPKGEVVPFERQRILWEALRRRYELVARETDFGQNATTLLLMRRRDGGQEVAK